MFDGFYFPSTLSWVLSAIRPRNHRPKPEDLAFSPSALRIPHLSKCAPLISPRGSSFHSWESRACSGHCSRRAGPGDPQAHAGLLGAGPASLAHEPLECEAQARILEGLPSLPWAHSSDLKGYRLFQEPWMASPETDSGFVGSETSRVSPLAQTPEHRLSHSRYPRAPHHQPLSVHRPGTAWELGHQWLPT